MLVKQNGTVRQVKHWVGLAVSPDGWKVDELPSSDFVKREIVYQGLSGNLLELNYREYRKRSDIPSFTQILKYDLNSSKIVTFQNFTLEIISANNSSTTFRVVSDSEG